MVLGVVLLCSAVLFVLVAVGLALGAALGSRSAAKKTDDAAVTAEEPAVVLPQRAPASKAKARGHAKDKRGRAPPAHPWQLATLKGHLDAVLHLVFSPDTKQLASVSRDRTVRLWDCAQMNTKDHGYSRLNIELDQGVSLAFSADNRALLVGLESRKARIFRLSTKKGGHAQMAMEFPEAPMTTHGKLLGMGMAASGEYKYLAAAFDNTEVQVWSLRGEHVQTIDTKMMRNSHLAVSPCGRFVGVCGFTPEVRLYEVIRGVHQLAKAMDLKGHSAGVLHFAFSPDSQRVVTVSKDGTWRHYRLAQRFAEGEECDVIASGRFGEQAEAGKGRAAPAEARVCLSPDYRIVTVGIAGNIEFFDGETGDRLGSIDGAHKGSITSMVFHAEGDWLATAGADKIIRVWHNVPGMQRRIAKLAPLLKQSRTSALQKERIEAQIKAAREKLVTILTTEAD